MKESNKVLIIGVSASGKSTFARKLAFQTDLPVFHMDELAWEPGWQYVGDEEFARKITDVATKSEWIIEGYIANAVRNELFSVAEKIIYLDYPGWLCAWRYLKRWWQHRRSSRPELPGSPEKFSWSFLKLVFTRGEIKNVEKLFKENDWQEKTVRLASPKQATQFLQSL